MVTVDEQQDRALKHSACNAQCVRLSVTLSTGLHMKKGATCEQLVLALRRELLALAHDPQELLARATLHFCALPDDGPRPDYAVAFLAKMDARRRLAWGLLEAAPQPQPEGLAA